MTVVIKTFLVEDHNNAMRVFKELENHLGPVTYHVMNYHVMNERGYFSSNKNWSCERNRYNYKFDIDCDDKFEVWLLLKHPYLART